MFHRQGPTFLELSRQALSSTQQGYDLLAPKFDYTPFRTPDPVLEEVGKLIQSRGPFTAAIDLCCGTGAGIEMLQRASCDKIVGIDFSQGMLDQAANNLGLGEQHDESIELINGDVLDHEFSESFDLAVCFGAFGHIKSTDEQAFIERIANCLRPGGRFIFVTHVVPKWYTKSALIMRGFNLAMRVRNLLIRPPFIMYYMTFVWPKIGEKLKPRFRLKCHQPFSGKLSPLRLIEAIKS